MAKKAAPVRKTQTAEPSNDLIGKLSATTRKALDGVRGQFRDYTKAFGVMLQKRSDLADPLMKLYGACLSELGRLTFVNFLRMIDPSMPTNRDEEEIGGKVVAGYRTHPSYQAGLYLQRLTTGQAAGGRTGGRRGVRGINAVDRMARILATMIPLVADESKFWQAVGVELQIDGAALTRLQNRTKETEPLIKLPNLKVKIPVKVIHIAPTQMETEQPQSRSKAA